MKKKNTYLTPLTEELDLWSAGLIATSIPVSNETTEDNAVMSRRHKIWGKDKIFE